MTLLEVSQNNLSKKYMGMVMVSNGNVKYNGCFGSLSAFVYSSVLIVKKCIYLQYRSDAAARSTVIKTFFNPGKR